jgi:hypothetical protein
MTDKENFIQAVKNDEYAEYELPCGAVLITDWEGDGVFNPYVVTYHIDDGITNAEQKIVDDITEAFSVDVRAIEGVTGEGLYYPVMNRPTA